MRVFVAVLALVAAATASSAAELPQQAAVDIAQAVNEHARVAADALQKVILGDNQVNKVAEKEIPSNIEPNKPAEQEIISSDRLFEVFTAPLSSRDFLPMENFGALGVSEKPLVVAIKQNNNNGISAFLLRGGFKSIFTSAEALFLREYLVSGPKKVGLMLSAARYLDLPELSLPLASLELPAGANLNTVYRISQEYNLLPWMLITPEQSLPANIQERVFELGQFAIGKDSIKITRDNFPSLFKKPTQQIPEAAYNPTLAALIYAKHTRVPVVFEAPQRQYAISYPERFEVEPLVHRKYPAISEYQFEPLLQKKYPTISEYLFEPLLQKKYPTSSQYQFEPLVNKKYPAISEYQIEPVLQKKYPTSSQYQFEPLLNKKYPTFSEY